MIGNRIKQLREEKGLKQEELAKVLSISPSAVGMYERDEREPNDLLTLKLSTFFNVSTDYLLGKSDERNISEYYTPEIRAIARDVAKLKPEKKELFKNLLKQMSDEADEASKR